MQEEQCAQESELPDLKKLTPVMQQYFRAKQNYPDALLLFRLGDFYELFFQDAEVASKLLNLTLTARGKTKDGSRIPMAGVPHHAASAYITRLLAEGYNVALCEQLADPSEVRGIVPREVVQVLTPGLVTEPDALDAKRDNPLVAICAENNGSKKAYGIAALEVSRGELLYARAHDEVEALAIAASLEPREVLLPPSVAALESPLREWNSRLAIRLVEEVAPCSVSETLSAYALPQVVEGRSVNDDQVPFHAKGRDQAPSSCVGGAVALTLRYAQEANPSGSLQLVRVAEHLASEHLHIESATAKHLELVCTTTGETEGSLLHAVDFTCTPMGGRCLRRRLLCPSRNVHVIGERLKAVRVLMNSKARLKVREALQSIDDLERIANRIMIGKSSARDLGCLRDSLLAVGQLAWMKEHQTLNQFAPADTCKELLALLQNALIEGPLANTQTEGILTDSYNDALRELRQAAALALKNLLSFEELEREHTSIGSLKVRSSKVFGYFIEVTRSQLAKVPPHYRRKQTIANGERYTCTELDRLQTELERAERAQRSLEADLIESLESELRELMPRVQHLAHALAHLDVSAGFAELAHKRNYHEPVVDESTDIILKASRHPVIETRCASFVPNDVQLSQSKGSFMLITGPNMAGKSTVMRQVALNVLLAQAGSYVPCAEARIGVVDRVLTRVGAGDRLSHGQSTFMVEMLEVAAILQTASRHSLIVVDEVGRGTGTKDGVAIAQAVAEHIHGAIRCRALFATHYQELFALEASHPGIVNYNVKVHSSAEGLQFLHVLAEGRSSESYGIEVARLADLPPDVIRRAYALIERKVTDLPEQRRSPARERPGPAPPPRSELELELLRLDLASMTPLDALTWLYERQQRTQSASANSVAISTSTFYGGAA